jgi:hypothetical protein
VPKGRSPTHEDQTFASVARMKRATTNNQQLQRGKARRRDGHAPACGSLLETGVALAQAKDDGEDSGLERVDLDLAYESGSTFKNFDLRSLTNLFEDIEEGDGQAI